jgi:hypothetical protein
MKEVIQKAINSQLEELRRYQKINIKYHEIKSE